MGCAVCKAGIAAIDDDGADSRGKLKHNSVYGGGNIYKAGDRNVNRSNANKSDLSSNSRNKLSGSSGSTSSRAGGSGRINAKGLLSTTTSKGALTSGDVPKRFGDTSEVKSSVAKKTEAESGGPTNPPSNSSSDERRLSEANKQQQPTNHANTQSSAGGGGDTLTNGGPARRDLSSYRLVMTNAIDSVYDVSNQVLGTGISGAVRVATNRFTGKLFAVKTLSLENVSAKKASMLRNEVSIYLKLDHPNIAKLTEVFMTENSIHLVMELCTGGELYDRLANKKKYSEGDAAHIARQMLSAIKYCHQHRICHRDLKLENWVFADETPDAPLKLIDFGFSRIFNPGIPMTAMHGTVYYVSPEVMDGCYRERCDIWSIGVIVFMLLSGSPPFNGTYDHEILVKVKRGVFSFSGPRWEGISDAAKDFISSLLKKDPDARPSAEAALQHPWLTQKEAEEHAIDTSVLVSMRNFAVSNILKRVALSIVALGMTSVEVFELEKAFKLLDKGDKGFIALQDLVKVLSEQLGISPVEAHRIFERVDQTGKKQVQYTEFIASTLQAKIIKDERLVLDAFRRLISIALNSEGGVVKPPSSQNLGPPNAQNDKVEDTCQYAITLAGMRAIFGGEFYGSRVEDVMALCDRNKDGMIDFDEFSAVMLSEDVVDDLSDVDRDTDGVGDASPARSTPTNVKIIDGSQGADDEAKGNRKRGSGHLGSEEGGASSHGEGGSYGRRVPRYSAATSLRKFVLPREREWTADSDFGGRRYGRSLDLTFSPTSLRPDTAAAAFSYASSPLVVASTDNKDNSNIKGNNITHDQHPETLRSDAVEKRQLAVTIIKSSSGGGESSSRRSRSCADQYQQQDDADIR